VRTDGSTRADRWSDIKYGGSSWSSFYFEPTPVPLLQPSSATFHPDNGKFRDHLPRSKKRRTPCLCPLESTALTKSARCCARRLFGPPGPPARRAPSTDGEARRKYFHLDFLSEIGGIGQRETADDELPAGTTADGSLKKPPVVTVTGKLEWKGAVAVDDFTFLRDELARAQEELKIEGPLTAKVCIPSPTMVHFRGGRGAICEKAYPDLEVFYEDLAAVYRKELRALYDAGARFVQLDDTNLAYLCDEGMRAEVKRRDDDPDELPRRYAVCPPFSLFYGRGH
jgi:hypothetical protein